MSPSIPGKPDVGDEQVDLVVGLSEVLERPDGVRRVEHLIAGALEPSLDQRSNRVVVLHDKNDCQGRTMTIGIVCDPQHLRGWTAASYAARAHSRRYRFLDVTGEDDRAFRLRDTVILLNGHGEIAAGSVGRVIGRFVQGDPTYVVWFEGDERRIAEIHPDDLSLAEFS